MGRGASRSLDWESLNIAFDEVINTLEVKEISKFDFFVLVYNKYFKLSGHKMHLYNCNSAPVSRIRNCITSKQLKNHGWRTGRRRMQGRDILYLIKIDNTEEIE